MPTPTRYKKGDTGGRPLRAWGSMDATPAKQENAMPYERRHFVRVSFDAPAQLATPTDTLSVHVHDLSLKGALITAPPQATLVPGMLCQLTIALAESNNHIAMSTEVAHSEGLHTGLLCRSIDLDSVTHLRRLIELQLGDPALLERDLGELMHSASPP